MEYPISGKTGESISLYLIYITIQGNKDDVVPVEHTIEYARRYGVRLHMVAGADHFYSHPGDVDELMSEARRFYIG